MIKIRNKRKLNSRKKNKLKAETVLSDDDVTAIKMGHGYPGYQKQISIY